jgi:hypothetical protein
MSEAPMTRRLIALLITLALGLLSLAADAQPPGKLARVGVLQAIFLRSWPIV